MVAQQCHALFRGIVALATLMLITALVPVLGPGRAQAGFALFALFALDPFLFRKRRKEVAFDERDRAINLRATQATFMILWVLFVAAAMSFYWMRGSNGTISAEVLPLMVEVGGCVLLLCHSATLLFLHWWS